VHRLLFLDLETTGLDPQTDVILEVACAVAEPGASAVGGFCRAEAFNSLVHWGVCHSDTEERLQQMRPVVQEMHAGTGLTRDLLTSTEFLPVGEVEHALLNWMDENRLVQDVILAGNSIYFDRAFLARHMPRVHSRLHYRMVDVTSLQLAKDFVDGYRVRAHDSPPVVAGVQHRALYDVVQSMQQFDYLVR